MGAVAISQRLNMGPRIVSIHKDADGNGGQRDNLAFVTLPTGEGPRGVRIVSIAGVCGTALNASSQDSGVINN